MYARQNKKNRLPCTAVLPVQRSRLTIRQMSRVPLYHKHIRVICFKRARPLSMRNVQGHFKTVSNSLTECNTSKAAVQLHIVPGTRLATTEITSESPSATC